MEIGEGPAYVSYSQITTWLGCGKAYELSRIERVEEQPAWWFAGGSAVHKASEVFDLQLYAAEGR